MGTRSGLVAFTLCLALAGAMIAGPAAAVSIKVTSLKDDDVGCTLRNALRSADTDTSVGGCAAGSGNDTINLPSGTITLNDTLRLTRTVMLQGRRPSPFNPVQSTVWDNVTTLRVAGYKRIVTCDSPGNDQSFILANLNLVGNAPSNGGGISVWNGDTLRLWACKVTKGRSAAGGGIFSVAGFLDIHRSVIAGNEATSAQGGGIYTASSGDGVRMSYLFANMITGNAAAGDGGGVYVLSTEDINLENNTIAGNRAGGRGGALAVSTASPAEGSAFLCRNILWGNEAGVDGAQMAVNCAGPCIEALDNDVKGDPSMGFSLPPRFVKARPASAAPTTGGDYHLRQDSPCIVTGMGYDLDQRDIEGDFRLNDIGADEVGRPLNDSFEYATLPPAAAWVGRNLGIDDRRVSDVHHRGNWSFRITGSPKAKVLRQVFTNLGGEQFGSVQISGWSRVEGANAGGKYQMEARIYYFDGTTKLIEVPFSPLGAAGWQYRESAQVEAADFFAKVVVTLRFSGQTGTAWFDDIHLEIQPGPEWSTKIGTGLPPDRRSPGE